jgi:hypothetical protein
MGPCVGPGSPSVRPLGPRTPASAQHGCQPDCRKQLKKRQSTCRCGLNSPGTSLPSLAPSGARSAGLRRGGRFSAPCTEVMRRVAQEQPGHGRSRLRCRDGRTSDSVSRAAKCLLASSPRMARLYLSIGRPVVSSEQRCVHGATDGQHCLAITPNSPS